MRRLITFALLCVMLASSLFCLASLAQASALEQSDTPSGVEFSELNQLSDKKIGTVLGTTYDYDVWNIVEPDPDFVYYADTSEMLTALKYGRIDACCLDYPVATIALERNEGLGIMPEDAGLDANAVAMPKGSPLTKKVTDIVKKFVEDGTMDELEREWCMSPEDSRALPDADWPTTGDTLVCAVDDATEPMSYRNDNGELMGLEVELAYRIARELNMDLELQTMSFDAIAASLNSNTIDMAIAGISITDERSESFDLTGPYRSAVVTLVVHDTSAYSGDPVGRLYYMLHSTFIRNGHGLMLLQGLGNTLVLAATTVLFGVPLGYSLAMAILALSSQYGTIKLKRLRRTRTRLRKILHAVLCTTEQVMCEVPVVVVLLVFKYLVFGNRSSMTMLVAVAGLTGALACNTSRIVREATTSIPTEIWESALALGYTPRLAYLRVMKPLARKIYAPGIHAAIIQSVFDTSVVGLIAVHDITRMSDLVRSRTTEALPTLVVMTATYLLLSYFLRHVIDLYVAKRSKREESRDSSLAINT